jgi:hypothetical protein
MTMTEGVVRPDALSARDGRLILSVHLPWYRSLPLSCLESVVVAIDGVPVPVERVAIPGFAGLGFAGRVEDAAHSDAIWDLRDPLEASLGKALCGNVVALAVDLAVRIPYIQQAPGVPLVQRAAVRTEATIR